MAGNREYKSDVFSLLMQKKANALQVYNAVNQSDYEDEEVIEIVSLDRGISLSIRNDASFVLDGSLSIYEHQSTPCPNMPIRSLLYMASHLQSIVKKHNVYGQTAIRIPVPKFAVFYNGDIERPEQYDMKLSDLFEHQVDNPQAEIVVRVYNINNGCNTEFMERCPVMREYMIFVTYVKEYHAGHDYEDLAYDIEKAIDRCIAENVLKDFLIENRIEVIKVTQLDYSFERQLELERNDSRAEGRAEGRKEGLQDIIKNMMDLGKTLDEIMTLTGLSSAEIEQLTSL